MGRHILHVDMNAFYASVECQRRPELRQKPVAVCGDPEARHGIVLTANYVAKPRGVKTGMAIWQAKQLCPDLVVLPADMREYIRFSKMAREIYEKYTDQIEPFGLDESWLDVTGSVGLFGSAVSIAEEISERIKFELGITASIGVSDNKITAKLGSDYKKPDAITRIDRLAQLRKMEEDGTFAMLPKKEVIKHQAEIATPAHQALYKGKTLFEKGDFVSITLRKGGAKDPAHEVDAVTGGTKTSDGVTAMLRDNLSEYLPFFEKARTAASAAGAEESNDQKVESNE